MKTQHCLAIGINRYQFFQHLSFADADAQGLHKFLIEEAFWITENCLLLTDTSPSRTINNQSDNGIINQAETINTYPTQHNIVNTIQELLHKSLKPGDSLWFFFSGYGSSYNDEDYLMPIDGNPEKVIETGIPIGWLFEQLLPIGKGVFIILDINRSQGITGEKVVGYHTLQLAQKYNIPVLLSCQLDQFSHEAPALNHGLFTAGLLEALRYDQEITVSSLDWYLRSRLPELSEHHWLPMQIPLTVTNSPTSEDRHILQPNTNNIPLSSALTLSSGSQLSSVNSQITSSLPSPIETSSNTDSHNVQIPAWQARLIPTTESGANIVHQPNDFIPDYSRSTKTMKRTTNQDENRDDEEYELEEIEEEEKETIPVWKQLVFWGTGATLVFAMIIGVFIKNQKAFIGANNGQETKKTSKIAVNPIKDQGKNPTPNNKSSGAASTNSNQKQPEKNVNNTTENLTGESQVLLTVAQGLINKNDPGSYQKAMVIARRILPEEPGFMTARKSIDDWSVKIYQIAQNLAKKGDYQSAIKTVKLIPEDTPIYKEAQKSTLQWKGQKSTIKNSKPTVVKKTNSPQNKQKPRVPRKAGQLKPKEQ
jgi:Caspase domain